MKWTVPIFLLILLLLPSLSAGLDISSVYPNPAIVGNPVTVLGGPFSSSTRVVFGGREIVPEQVGERQLTFIVPPMEAGDHVLLLVEDQQKSEQKFTIRISLPPPEISSLNPTNVDECSTEEQRIVTLTGSNFREGSVLLLGGQIVPSTRESDTEISFAVPLLKAGTYGVQVTNPDGSMSLPSSLWLNNIPHIYDVSRGEDFVSSYQLIISGENFVQNSALIVYEYSIGQPNLPPQQQIVPEQGGSAYIGSGARNPLTAAVTYVDCNTLVYNRYPYSGQDKTLILRVSNPDGKQTEPHEISAP